MKFFNKKSLTRSRLKRYFLVGFFLVGVIGQAVPTTTLALDLPSAVVRGVPPDITIDRPTGIPEQYTFYVDPNQPGREIGVPSSGPAYNEFVRRYPAARLLGTGSHYTDPEQELRYQLLRRDSAGFATYNGVKADGTPFSERIQGGSQDALKILQKKYPGGKVTSRTDAYTEQLKTANEPDLPIAHPVDALIGGATDFLGGRAVAIIGTILGIFLTIVAFFFDIFARMIAQVLIAVLQFNNFTDLPQIKEAWVIMRDLSNMFFIVVLIAIAFGTMLHIEGYEWKSLLPRLLVMAVLVNFSRAIAGFMIDVSQIVMLTFVKAFTEKIEGGSFLAAMGIDSAQLLRLTGSSAAAIIGLGLQGPIVVVASMILAFIYLTTGAAILLMMLVTLVYRIIMLWVLTIFSPFAFALDTFPQGAKYASMWWEKITAELIVGPVMAFFIWLALKISEGVTSNNGNYSGGAFSENAFQALNYSVDKIFAVTGDVGQDVNAIMKDIVSAPHFINILITTTIFSAGMALASQAGAAGGEMAGELSGHITSFGKAATGGAFARIAKSGYNTADRFLATQHFDTGENKYAKMIGLDKLGLGKLTFSPTAIMKGWEGYWQEKEHEAFSASPGLVQDFLFKRANMTLGYGDQIKEKLSPRFRGAYDWMQENVGGEAISGRTTKFERRMRGAHVEKVMRDYASATMGAEETSKVFMEAEGRGNEEEQEALLKLVIRNNMQDDFMRVYYKSTGRSALPDSLMKRIDKNAQKAVAKAGARAQILSPANIDQLNADSLEADGRTVKGLNSMPPLTPPPAGTASVPPTPPTGGTPGTPQNAGSAEPKIDLDVNLTLNDSGDDITVEDASARLSAIKSGAGKAVTPTVTTSTGGVSASSTAPSGTTMTTSPTSGFALEGADKKTKRTLGGMNSVAASKAEALIAEEIKKRKIYKDENDTEGEFISEGDNEEDGDGANSLHGHYQRDSELDRIIGYNSKFKLEREKVHELMRTEMMARGVNTNNISGKEYNTYRDWALRKLTSNRINL